MYYIYDLDPVAFSFFGWPVYWYGISYLVAFGLGMWLMPKILGRIVSSYTTPLPASLHRGGDLKKVLTKEKLENFLLLTFLVGILGGRLGHFLFYFPDVILQNPLELLMLWKGGMAIHGGILASVLFIIFWARKNKVPFLLLSDSLVIPLCLGLALGRLANFVNGELVGVPTDQSWGVVFPFLDEVWRHPSQIYESARNLFLAGILGAFFWKNFYKFSGFLSGVFLVGYGVLRTFTGIWREPTVLFFDFVSMGQVLSLGMVVIGGILLWRTLGVFKTT